MPEQRQKNILDAISGAHVVLCTRRSEEDSDGYLVNDYVQLLTGTLRVEDDNVFVENEMLGVRFAMQHSWRLEADFNSPIRIIV